MFKQSKHIDNTKELTMQKAILKPFKKIRFGNKLIYVRDSMASELIRRGIADLERLVSNSKDKKIFEGRGETVSLPIKDGRMVIRHYHHGGIFRKLTRDIYWGITPRPLKELAVSEEARDKGLNTPEVLAVILRRYAKIFYKADIITREIEGGNNAYDYLRSAEVTSRDNIIRSAAETVRKMHDLGLYHPDLNLKNILIQDIDGKIKSFILDLDRACIKENLSNRERERNLLRLNRSVNKLGKDAPLVSKEDKLVFLRQYYKEGGD